MLRKAESDKLREAKARAKKAAEQAKAKKSTGGQRDEYNYRVNSKGHEVILFFQKNKKVIWDKFKAYKWVTAHHVWVFRELKKKGLIKAGKDGGFVLKKA